MNKNENEKKILIETEISNYFDLNKSIPSTQFWKKIDEIKV